MFFPEGNVRNFRMLEIHNMRFTWRYLIHLAILMRFTWRYLIDTNILLRYSWRHLIHPTILMRFSWRYLIISPSSWGSSGVIWSSHHPHEVLLALSNHLTILMRFSPSSWCSPGVIWSSQYPHEILLAFSWPSLAWMRTKLAIIYSFITSCILLIC